MLTIGPAQGIDEAIASLQQLSLEGLRPTLTDLLADIASDAATYPPERSGQRYQRTYTLRDGWLDAEPVFSGGGAELSATLTNSVPYAADVMGDGVQGVFFADRWRTDQQIADSWEARIANA